MKSLISNLHLIFTLDCEQSSRLISDSLDRHLTWSERWAVRLHAVGCWSCRRFRRQIQILRQMAQTKRTLLEDGDGEADRLPDATRDRIQKIIRERQSDSE